MEKSPGLGIIFELEARVQKNSVWEVFIRERMRVFSSARVVLIVRRPPPLAGYLELAGFIPIQGLTQTRPLGGRFFIS